MRKVSAECDRDVDGRLMLPVVLRPSPGESISAWFGFPRVGKMLEGVPMGKDVEEEQELAVNPTRGRHDTRQKGIGGAWSFGVSLAVSCKLGACHGFEELVDIEVAQLPVAAHVPEVLAT